MDKQPDPFPAIIEVHHITTFSRSKIHRALAIEAHKTLIFDRPELLAAADQAGIAVWSLEDKPQN